MSSQIILALTFRLYVISSCYDVSTAVSEDTFITHILFLKFALKSIVATVDSNFSPLNFLLYLPVLPTEMLVNKVVCMIYLPFTHQLAQHRDSL